MVKNEYVLVVDIKKKHTAIVPTFVQHDTATLIFKVFDNGKPFDLTAVTRVEVSHKRKDGAVVIGLASFETVAGQSIIKYDYMGNEMSVEGFVDTSVTIFSENTKVTIQPFQISIVGDFRNALGATQEFGLLQELIVTVENVIDDAKQAILRADSSSEKADMATSNANIAAENANASALNADQKATYVIANEDTRELAETQRKLDEDSRKSVESHRVLEEGIRNTAEGVRNMAEAGRVSEEDSRKLSETNRKDSEIARTAKESARDLAETSRKTNETARKTAETNRDTAETARVSSEADRLTNESTREVSEANRKSAEAGRLDSESKRVLSETDRLGAESARQIAETKRQEDTSLAIEKANTASDKALAIVDNVRRIGEYDTETQYYKNNTVGLNGSSYIALQDTLGNNPTDVGSLYWALQAQRGVDGKGSVASVNGTFPDPDGNVVLSVPEGHTHTNKAVLDKLTDTAGQLKYNGKEVGSVTSVNGQIGNVEGLETVVGSQEKATLAETNSKSYTDEKVVDLTVFEAKEEFIATEGQTVFTLVGEYEVGKNRISAVVGGVPQYGSFTETDSKTITFSEAVPTGVDVVFTYFKALPVGDGLVTSVNNIIPDPNGNVTLNIPEPDLSELATKLELTELEGTKGQPSGIATLGLDGKVPSEQLPKISNSAIDVSIEDTGNYYTGINAEDALQEIGQAMNVMRGSLIASVNGILQS